MGRPSGFDREAAIETAMQEFWSNGYETTSAKAISETLGITRSSFYNAFGSREELFKEALARYCAQSPDAALNEVLPDTRILELLTRTFRAVCAARASNQKGRGCLVINSLTELGGTHEELGALIMNTVLGGAARFEELLKVAVQNGELDAATDVHAKALALQNLLIGLNAFATALHDENELWLTAKTTLEALGLYGNLEHA